MLRTYIEQQKDRYDYILIDCMPSLGMITINAFASADSILNSGAGGISAGKRSGTAY